MTSFKLKCELCHRKHRSRSILQWHDKLTCKRCFKRTSTKIKGIPIPKRWNYPEPLIHTNTFHMNLTQSQREGLHERIIQTYGKVHGHLSDYVRDLIIKDLTYNKRGVQYDLPRLPRPKRKA